MNNNENTKYKNLWSVTKQKFKGRITDLNNFIRKTNKRFKIMKRSQGKIADEIFKSNFGPTEMPIKNRVKGFYFHLYIL